MPSLRQTCRFTLPLLGLLLLSACADTRYYLQAIDGHWQVLQAARPIDQWLADESAPPDLKQRLVLAQRMRAFAVSELKLPDNASYQRYADLHRHFVVWNVVAAPELSLKLKTWCFPVVGCVSYRGYFQEAQAREQADEQRIAGLETSVYGVPAYSTLGWLNWLGGDPLLNTFIRYPEGELARMIFHELAHQVVYVKDDSTFNESFATAVERLGSARWLASQGSDAARREYAELDARRRAFRALAFATREKLAALYKQNQPVALDKSTLVAMKNVVTQDFRNDYAQLKASWGGFAGYDAWVANANNAAFGALAVYDDWTPGFEALFEREGQDWQKFYDAVKRLAQLPALERAKALKPQELVPLVGGQVQTPEHTRG